MKKEHMTRKQLGNDVFVLSDNQLDLINKHYSPVGYNAGIYGWNYDIYMVRGKVLVHGYRPLLKWQRMTDKQFNDLIK